MALALAAPQSASAGHILSDIFKVYNSQGVVVFSASANELSENPDRLYFIPVVGLANPDQVNNPTYLTEPNNGISDVFGVTTVTEQQMYDAGYVGECQAFELVLAFQSDSETTILSGSNGNFLPEEMAVHSMQPFI